MPVPAAAKVELGDDGLFFRLDEALTKPADFLTAYTVTYLDPGRITDDFTFAPAANDDEFQRVTYVTENDGFRSTIGVIFGGLLLAGWRGGSRRPRACPQGARSQRLKSSRLLDRAR